MNLIIMGPPGSGKSTQAKLLSEKLTITVISGGDVSRQLASEDPKVKELVDAGELVPDQLLNDRFEKILDSEITRNGFILDGWPRHQPQLDFLLGYLKRTGKEIDHVIYIQLPQEEVIKRLTKRIETEKRSDDTPAGIKTRLEIFQNETKPMIDYWKNQGKLIEIDGRGTIEEVARLIANSVYGIL